MKISRTLACLPKAGCRREAAAALLLSAAVLFLPASLPRYAGAVPAAPGPAELSQADGGKVEVFLKGDEFYNWHEDAGGYAIIKDTVTKNWVYAEKDPKGALKKTTYKVGKVDPSRLGLARHLKDAGKLNSARARRSERDNFRGSSGPVPVSAVSISGAQPLNGSAPPAGGPRRTAITQGTMKNLVILARFPDQSSTYAREDFDSLFNQTGYTADGAVGSVKDFYAQASYGKLTVQSTVSQWVTLPQPAAYYGANSEGSDVNSRQMVMDAINALDAAGFDFSTVDGNGDGEVDGLDIIHSGRGEEYPGNNADYIWSHQWELAAPLVKDGKSMQVYHTESEIRGYDDTPSSWGLARIGVICHETGHFLGLPDLYDYGDDSRGLGSFCLMASGSWNGNTGTSPAHPSAWCKKSLNWVTPAALGANGSYSLARIEDSDIAVYKFSGSGFAATEYFLMENKQAFGFDGGLPGAVRGLLIWHVDETMPDNDDQTHYKVDLEEAGGTQHLAADSNNGDDADYYRSGTSFGDATTPNSKSYAALNLGKIVQNISASGNPMTFYYGPADATPPAAIAAVNDGAGADATYTASGSQLAANWSASSDPDSGLARYWYAIGTSAGAANTAGWTDNGVNTSVTRTGLTLANGQTYYFTVKAENGVGAQTAPVNSNGQTVDTTAPGAPATVNDGIGADIPETDSLTQLSANWTAAADAQSGIVKYWYAIGTIPGGGKGGTNVAAWTDNGANTSVTRTGLSLGNGQTYYFAVRAENGAGLLSAVASSNGQAVDTAAPGGMAEDADGNSVVVPAAAYPGPLWLTISTPAASVLDSADSRTYDSTGLRWTVLSREFNAVDAGGDPVGNFNSTVTIRLTWPDADNDGRVDGDYIKEELLRLYYLDPAFGRWVPVARESERKDAALNILEADVSHFSVYAIRSIAAGAQEMVSVKAYPNPCRLEGGSLKIGGIPVDAAGTQIRIYNAAGELVRTLKRGDGVDAQNEALWDGRNSSGAKAASGLYLYAVKTENYGKTAGKFVILW